MALRTRRRSTCRRTTSNGSVTLITAGSHVTDLAVQDRSGMWTIRAVWCGGIPVATGAVLGLFPPQPCVHPAPGRVHPGHDAGARPIRASFPGPACRGQAPRGRLEGAVELHDWADRTLVLGLPRGGVAVAERVAAVLAVPMNVMVTRKIGYPKQPELGVGAIAEIPGAAGCGPPVYDRGLLSALSITPADLTAVLAAEEAELARRVRVYRGGSPLPRVAGWCVIVVDDGLATGATARAAL